MVDVYAPALNGTAFLGMARVNGAKHGYSNERRFVEEKDFDALYNEVVKMREQVGELRDALKAAHHLMAGAMLRG